MKQTRGGWTNHNNINITIMGPISHDYGIVVALNNDNLHSAEILIYSKYIDNSNNMDAFVGI